MDILCRNRDLFNHLYKLQVFNDLTTIQKYIIVEFCCNDPSEYVIPLFPLNDKYGSPIYIYKIHLAI